MDIFHQFAYNFVKMKQVVTLIERKEKMTYLLAGIITAMLIQSVLH